MTRTMMIMAAACLAIGAGAAAQQEALVPGDNTVSFVPTDADDARPRIDVVFALDTTGSMGGLIDGAKRKIWSIANEIASARPVPTLRVGLLAYRDVGDEYVTRLVPLNEDLDAIYAALTEFVASGGGDGPESVNQALRESVERFEWTDAARALRVVYLVGDAPPHMDYPNDIHYHATCRVAAERGIIVNTILCGADHNAAEVWREVARLAEGEYFQIEQSGGVVAIATPMDEAIASLGQELDGTLLAYGTERAQAELGEKVRLSAALHDRAEAPAGAARAIYKVGEAGGATLGGAKELVRDLAEGAVKLDDIPETELPPVLRALPVEARAAYVQQQAERRNHIRAQIQSLSAQRAEFLKAQGEGGPRDAFDSRVFEALVKQAARLGIVYHRAPSSDCLIEQGDSPDGGR